MNLLLVAHAFTSFFMTGLIWFVQVVHYPLFRDVGANEFGSYEQRHRQRTTWVVAPLMVTELVTAAFLLLNRNPRFDILWTGTNLGLVVAIWAVTAVVQVPQHGRLSQGFDRPTWQHLVSGNWVRTVLWSLHSLLVVALLLRGSESSL